MSTRNSSADKPDGRPEVTGEEVQQWIDIIRERYPDEADLAGGVAPATIIAHADRERAVGTVHRHLSDEGCVEIVWGIHRAEGQGAGKRQSYVPTEGER